MSPIWWLVWMIFIFWVFAMPYDIPDQRKRKDTPLDILQRRFAMGQMTIQEYKERKIILEEDFARQQASVASGKKNKLN